MLRFNVNHREEHVERCSGIIGIPIQANQPNQVSIAAVSIVGLLNLVNVHSGQTILRSLFALTFSSSSRCCFAQKTTEIVGKITRLATRAIRTLRTPLLRHL